MLEERVKKLFKSEILKKYMKKGVYLILAIIFDNKIAYSVVNYRNNFLTALMLSFSFIGSSLMVFIITTLLFISDKRKRSYIPVLWLTLLIAVGLGFFIKLLVARPRPEFLPLEIKNSYSFPSGHALAVFAPLALIDKEFPKLKWFWFCIALIVLFSRLYLGVHYLSDVIAGALIGYLTGLFVLIVTKNM